MIEKLEAQGVSYKRIPAIEAKARENSWLIEGSPAEITGFRMGRGEHAVHASHYDAWKQADADGLEAVIILEDDAVLGKNFSEIFELSWIPFDADVVKLEAYWGEAELGPASEYTLPGRKVHRLHSLHLGAAGYLVTAKGLKKLLQHVSREVIRNPIDRALFDRHSSLFQLLTVYQLEPAIVRQAEFFESADLNDVKGSDLIAGRNAATQNGAAYGNPNSFARQVKRLALRIKSRAKGRQRVVSSFQ